MLHQGVMQGLQCYSCANVTSLTVCSTVIQCMPGQVNITRHLVYFRLLLFHCNLFKTVNISCLILFQVCSMYKIIGVESDSHYWANTYTSGCADREVRVPLPVFVQCSDFLMFIFHCNIFTISFNFLIGVLGKSPGYFKIFVLHPWSQAFVQTYCNRIQ